MLISSTRHEYAVAFHEYWLSLLLYSCRWKADALPKRGFADDRILRSSPKAVLNLGNR